MIRNTLGALALIVTTVQPAAADTKLSDILAGIIIGAVIIDAAKSNNHSTPNNHSVYVIDTARDHNRIVQSQSQADRQIQKIQRETVCRIQDRIHNNGMIIREEFNCAGEMIRFYFP